MIFSIYIITNTVNGKRYIGQSSNPTSRWSSHRKKAFQTDDRRHHLPLYLAMRKYGLESFRFEVFEEHATRELADAAEIRLIRFFGTRRRDQGYNLDPGGDAHDRSAETRARISAAVKGKGLGRKVSPESRARMSVAQRAPSVQARRQEQLRARSAQTSAILRKLHADPIFKSKRLVAIRSAEVREKNSKNQRVIWAQKKLLGINDRNITGIMQVAAQRKQRTHCKRGHELTEDNLYPSALKVGSRSCRKCGSLRSQLKYSEEKAKCLSLS